ncbi:hypothetical protein [Microlunatus flavus]|uniref:hypothetical protein n=1 Tax=Microlunatus flavus TaxID=1036181 RepID=UPI000B81647D|nr:hypothetical protein [Microlunatus flavus]
MVRRRTRRGLVLGVSLLALVGFGCTRETTPPPPPVSTSATPTESAQEREERLAYEAAEKSYRDFRAEYRRALNAGGASSATSPMKAVAGGSYLQEATEVLQAYKGLQQHSSGAGKIVYVQRQGYSATSLVLMTCEDTRSVKIFDKAGKMIGRGEQRQAELEVRLEDGSWKVWSGRGRKVTSCDA